MASAAVQPPTGHSTSFEPRTSTTTNGASPVPHDVQTTLQYYKDPRDGSVPPPAYVGKPETYVIPMQAEATLVHDARGREHEFSLDKQGFQFYKHASAETAFDDDARIKGQYYAEVEQLLKDATGASRVFIFDHTIRRAAVDKQPQSSDGASAPPIQLRGPVNRVHIDQSYEAARGRVPHHLPAEAGRLLRSRVQIINVWRPIRRVLRDPLGVADARSVPDSDLVGVGLIYPDRRGETYIVRPAAGHRWHFLYGQDVDEVTLIKCFDSKLDGRARRVPHSAFADPAHAEDYARESIEVRCLVFHEDQSAE